MSQEKVFVTRQIPQAGLDLLESHVDIEIWSESYPPSHEVLLSKIPDYDGLLCLLTDSIDEKVIAAGQKLKVISQMAVGYDNIDIGAATERGIPVGNTPGVLTEATADLTWALLMSLARRLPEAQAEVKEGKWQTWQPMGLLGADFMGATLGIIGCGRIGQAVARRAKGFDMKVLYYNRKRLSIEQERDLGLIFASLDDLLAKSDFISLHTPLTEETYHLINNDTLAKMKPTALLINTARGGIINQEALYQALIKGNIAGAALDVTEPEPLPSNHPLLSLSNVLITPHIGSASYQTRSLMATMAASNLLAGIRGEILPHCVNPQVFPGVNYPLL